jgi:autotransporter-associated beta strand protein
MSGGKLTIAGTLDIDGGSVTGGQGAGASGDFAGDGSAFGAGIFFAGQGGSLTFQPGAGQIQLVADAIADLTGSGGNGTCGIVKEGAGTLILGAGNSYTGGTELNDGTLFLMAAKAAGTGSIAFAAGSQTLAIANAALPGGEFGNTIVGFGSGDAVALTDLDFSISATVTYHPGDGGLVVESGGVAVTMTMLKPQGIDFVLANDGTGGTEIVLGEGVTITGTKGDDLVDAKHTAPGEPLPTKSADLIDALGGADDVSGLAGNDWIIGGKGNDFLNGNKGDDRLEGGLGRNKLDGGKGVDTFVLRPDLDEVSTGKGVAKADGRAKILGFDIDEDLIELDAEVFLAIGPTLDEGEFRIGLKAKDEDDFILYQASSGRLLYDEDGQGGKDAIQFARLDKKLDLDESHFLIA